ADSWTCATAANQSFKVYFGNQRISGYATGQSTAYDVYRAAAASLGAQGNFKGRTAGIYRHELKFGLVVSYRCIYTVNRCTRINTNAQGCVVAALHRGACRRQVNLSGCGKTFMERKAPDC